MTDQQMLARQARNKTAVERSFTAWRDGTGSPFDLLAENATWTIVGHSVASKRYDNSKRLRITRGGLPLISWAAARSRV